MSLELPGMWHESDLSGGQTDCAPLAHHSEVIFNKGWDALAAGHSRESCPYFGHTSRAAWLHGYDCAASDQDTGDCA